MRRREFMTNTAVAGAAAALGIESAFGQAAKDEPAGKKPGAVDGGIQRHRVLGRTGLWLSDIGMGTGQLGHPVVAVRKPWANFSPVLRTRMTVSEHVA